MQSSFGIIMLTIVAGQPRVLSLKENLALFIAHRKEVVLRRTHFDLEEATRRAHILEGLKIAVENIDEVIALIKKSPGPAEAKVRLMEQFGLTDIQAQAILELRLQRLTGLEREKIVQEYDEVLALIIKLKEILAKEELVYQIITDELTQIKSKYADARRTQIITGSLENLSDEDFIQEEEMVVTVSHLGYIKRNPISLYRAQRRGGRGKTGMTTREEDFVEQIFVASTHSYILAFTNKGKMHWLKVHEVPLAGRTTRGKAISNLIQLQENEKVTTLLPMKSFGTENEEGKNGGCLVFVTQKGTVKKTSLSAYSHPRAGGIIALNIEPQDELVEVKLSDGRDILISTREGQTIRFADSDVRPMGRTATGVRGISLAESDGVVGTSLVNPASTLLTVSENGYGKRTTTEEYRVQGRGGSGVITLKTTDKTGAVVATIQVEETDDVMLITNLGKIIRMHVKQISVMGRNTQGVRLIHVEEGEKVVAVAKLAERDENGDEINGTGAPPIATPEPPEPNV